MSTITLVRGDDWEGIYVDGKLMTEGHSIEISEAIWIGINHKATKVETKFCDLGWLHDEGNLPQALADVKLEA